MNYGVGNPDQKGSQNAILNPTARSQDIQLAIALFAYGGEHFESMIGCRSIWDTDDLENTPFVEKLDHPFTNCPNYFPSVALHRLNLIISNPRQRSHHKEAVKAIVIFLRLSGSKCARFLSAFVPRIHWLLGRCVRPESTSWITLTELENKIMIRLQELISRAWLDYMLYVCEKVLLRWKFLKYLDSMPLCVISVCNLPSKFRIAIGDHFAPIISTVLPYLLECLSQDRSGNGAMATAVWKTLETFSTLFGVHETIILEFLTKLILEKNLVVCRKEARLSLISLLQDMSDMKIWPSVFQPLIQVPGLREVENLCVQPKYFWKSGADQRMNLMCYVESEETSNLWKSGVCDIQKIKKSEKSTLNCPYEQHLVRWAKPDFGKEASIRYIPVSNTSRNPTSHKHNITEAVLLKSWDVQRGCGEEDWASWYANLGAAMLEQSKRAAFRSCVRISESCPQFTKLLFNGAFPSCWKHPLSPESKVKLVHNVGLAISSDTIPLNIIQPLLIPYEFMYHDEKPLRTSNLKLAKAACKFGAFAKGVRYRYLDYAQHLGAPERIEMDIDGEDGLISTYDRLRNPEWAICSSDHFKSVKGSEVEEIWFEKLPKWNDALLEYQKVDVDFKSVGKLLYTEKPRRESFLGILSCLKEIGEWQDLNGVLQKSSQACAKRKYILGELALHGKGASGALDLGR
ncbi:unnamed protein product [Agarophyton chilense]